MTQRVAQAILFDLNGTLVDSAASVQRSWQRLAAELDRPYEDIEPFIQGSPSKQALRMIDPEMSPERIEELAEMMSISESTDTGDCIPLPGAFKALDVLPTKRWAIVTSGSRRLATARIAAAGLPMPRFLITSDDVLKGKPDPAPYLLGASRLGREPGRCLVFEGAPAGITSANAAGIPVIGLRTTHRSLVAPSIANLSKVEFSADRLGVIITY